MPINPSFRLTKITCSLLVATLLAACSTATKTTFQPVEKQAEAAFSDLDPRLRVIGLHADDSIPQLDVEGVTTSGKSTGAAALYGAGGGLVGCMNFVAFPIVGAFLMAACLPFGLVVGAAVGSAQAGKTNADSDHSLENNLKSLQAAASREMLEALEEYANFNGIPTFRITSSRSASASLPNRVLTILDVKIVRISHYVAKSIGVEARVTVYTLPGRIVADRYTLVIRPSDEFRNDDAELHKRGYREIARAAFDESILVYRHEGEQANHLTPGSAKETATTPFPDYTLRPLDPPFISSSVDQRQRKVFVEHESLVETLRPVFRWESMPITFSSDPLVKDRIRDITYEFVLHSGRPYFNQGFVPSQVSEFTKAGLTEPQFEMEAALSPCTLYFWSVRAHFMLDNQPRVTEWSGAYNLDGLAVMPSLFRRSGDTVLRNTMFYPGFRTPGECDVPTYKADHSVPHDPRRYNGLSGKALNQH